jgi:hypothetical protein
MPYQNRYYNNVAIGSYHSSFFTAHKSERRDLNPRPPLPQSGALPSCATPRQPLYTNTNS